ncbi:hypothetical protein [Nitrosomonas europaea]|uniref:Uncharacterized protein n=1 Tax=Nitrosomonas europaea (strain ATCC 19718 / CIP 103999 / KCTC 2705 / NBRC 14298) TaxID=228410 RepID=Q82SB6_NITEU|nr:hypothetical protein NE2430 [Nitrosomonas europaea ATCC 19718]
MLDLIAIVVLVSGLYLWLRKPKTITASASNAEEAVLPLDDDHTAPNNTMVYINENKDR